MMLKLTKKLFPIAIQLKNGNYTNEFEDIKNKINISRCKIIGKVVLVLNIILIMIDLFIYKGMRVEKPAYTYLYYSHIFSSALIGVWLFIMRKSNESRAYNNKLSYFIFLNIVIYWSVFMGLNSLNISGQISAYIICVLSLAITTYLTPLEGILLYGSSCIIFSSGLFLSGLDSDMLYSHIVNSTFAAICSCGASILNYKHFVNDFINKKTILRGKAELEEINIKLREYEKLRTDFFANISHELKTPLNVIHSAEYMIYSSLNGEEYDSIKINKYLKMIKQNSRRLIRLINNLIDLTKIDATIFELKLTNHDIVRVIENITMSVSDYIENKGVTLIFDTEIEEKVIAIDPDKIERIMLNLLSNAIKFTDKNGEIFVNIFLTDDNVNISVKDTGIGIPDEMQKLIFDRFIQVDKSITRNREGSGIGLALVKSLVELHGGNIKLNSKVGQGSEFIFSLPDIKVGNKYEEVPLDRGDNKIEMINIEFSDIYQ